MAPTFGYWSIRGMVNPIKYILAYAGEEVKLETYHQKQNPDGSADDSAWTDVKYKLGLALPNLPYYIDGDLKITESGAILHHLARKYDLDGKTERDRIKLDMFAGVLKDIEYKFAQVAYSLTPLEESLPPYKEFCDEKFRLLLDLMGGKWILGEKISYADFLFYERLAVNSRAIPGYRSKFPKAESYMERFENLPAIRKYMASPLFIDIPLSGINSQFDEKYFRQNK